MKTYTAWLALCVAAICPVGAALGGEVQCPVTIEVDQKIIIIPAGWTVGYNGFTDELTSVTVYDGPPELGASLMYSDEKTVADSVTQTWRLASGGRGNWLTYGYSNTSAQLSQKIPADVTRCEVTFERNVSFGDGRHPMRKAICTSADPGGARKG
jgi:hypothetical protein